ncbi:MAG: glycoside hydrolase family 43 protein [Acidimicrobiales bacterium]|jgi:hypothetical protein
MTDRPGQGRVRSGSPARIRARARFAEALSPGIALVALAALAALAAALVATLVVTRTTGSASPPPSHRPRISGAVYRGDFPDPSVLVVDGRYYAYATQSGGFHIQVITSTDLAKWSAPKEALPVLPVWSKPGDTWAPAVAPDPSGGFEMFYAARDAELGIQCIGRAVSRSPLGPFVDTSRQPFLCQVALGGSIDPYVMADGGTDYLVWKSDGANGAPQQVWSERLSDGDDALVGVPSLLLSASAPWENGVVEGPAMLPTANGLFLFFSGNRWSTSSYSIGVVGCDSPSGPCANGLSPQAVSTASGVSGPGGPSFFTADDGQELMAYAAWSGVPGSPSGKRELYLDAVDTSGSFPTLVEFDP